MASRGSSLNHSLTMIEQFVKQAFVQFNCVILAHFVTTVTTNAFFLFDRRDLIDHNCIPGACLLTGTTGGAF